MSLAYVYFYTGLQINTLYTLHRLCQCKYVSDFSAQKEDCIHFD